MQWKAFETHKVLRSKWSQIFKSFYLMKCYFLPRYEFQMPFYASKKLPKLFSWLQRYFYIPRTYHLDALGMRKSTFSEGQNTRAICPFLELNLLPLSSVFFTPVNGCIYTRYRDENFQIIHRAVPNLNINPFNTKKFFWQFTLKNCIFLTFKKIKFTTLM